MKGQETSWEVACDPIHQRLWKGDQNDVQESVLEGEYKARKGNNPVDYPTGVGQERENVRAIPMQKGEGGAEKPNDRLPLLVSNLEGHYNSAKGQAR